MYLIAVLFWISIFTTISGGLLIAWWTTNRKIYGKILLLFWLGVIGLFVSGYVFKIITDKKAITQKDYYGHYIINRDYFKGTQADWQYNNFRFEIKENDSIYFYVTEKEKVIDIYKGVVKTTDPSQYSSARLIMYMDQHSHHILSSNPTTYRSAWDFYLVFYSPKFNNMYFKKGEWEPIE